LRAGYQCSIAAAPRLRTDNAEASIEAAIQGLGSLACFHITWPVT